MNNTYGEVIEKELGTVQGRKYIEKESWWWEPEVNRIDAEKRKAFKVL